jgi:hypothetical protein
VAYKRLTAKHRIKGLLAPGFSARFRAQLSHPEGYFRAGNQEALKQNLTEEAHAKRMRALFRGWKTRARLRAGEVFVPPNQTRKIEKRKRMRLHMTVAKEQREIQDLARKGAEHVMKRMIEIANTSFNETAAIAAASVVLERAYGKANQTNINATVDANGKATDVSGKELDSRIEQTLKRVEAITGRASKATAGKKQSVDIRKHDRDPDSSSLH